MRKRLPSIVFGCLGFIAGFAVCYATFVRPAPNTQATIGQPWVQSVVMHGPMIERMRPEWHPRLVLPAIPPIDAGPLREVK